MSHHNYYMHQPVMDADAAILFNQAMQAFICTTPATQETPLDRIERLLARIEQHMNQIEKRIIHAQDALTELTFKQTTPASPTRKQPFPANALNHSRGW